MEILDCTLRDGGYYTNWDFDKEIVNDYCSAMESLPIDYVEIGYRSMPMRGYLGEYYYCPDYLMAQLKENMPSKKLSVILNEKDIKIENLNHLLNPCKPYIDLIRIAISPENIQRAIPIAHEIKEKEFQIGFNIMYMSSWMQNKTFIEELHKLNSFVDYFYMVDSFGGILPADIKKITNIIKTKTTSKLGFHGHNNLELGLINSIIAIEEGCSIIDATITGMGRGAGNLKTELLMIYLASIKKININLNELSNIVSAFEDLQKQYQWGTNLPYMISGANSLPQKEVMAWISKKRYSISGIVNALQNKVEEVHLEIEEFKGSEKSKTALIIGGGDSVHQHHKAIKRLINQDPNSYIIIHAGVKHAKLLNDIAVPQYYSLVGNEGYRLKKIFKNMNSIINQGVLAPHPRKMGTFIPQELGKKISELKEVNFTEKYSDSPLAVSIQIALDLDTSQLLFAGFDGYQNKLTRTEFELAIENQYIFDALNKRSVKYSFITQTNYKNILVESIFSKIK